MMNSAVAKRYGKALLQLAQENNCIDLYQEELQTVVDAINSTPELDAVWNGKEFDSETKIKAVKAVFTGKVSAHIVNLLCVIVTKGRENALADILAVYKIFADEARNIAYADVTTAFALTAEQEAALSGKLSAATGKTIRLTVTVDNTLLGGMRVKYGDKVYDGTATARLQGMKEKLHEIEF